MHSNNFLPKNAIPAALILGLVSSLIWNPTAEAQIIWDGTEKINAASGDAVVSDDITLDGNTSVELIFGLEYLVVAGGGGGGGVGSVTNAGGGGGAGGLLKFVDGESGNTAGAGLFEASSQSYSVTVGAGGAGGVTNARGEDGANSAFDSIEAIGGGGGGAGGNSSEGGGSDGGSGGGGGSSGSSALSGGSGTANQGSDGGNGVGGVSPNTADRTGGGGGGAGGPGVSPDGSTAADGGPGISSTITGTSNGYAGGGGGGAGSQGNRGSGTDGGGQGQRNSNGQSGSANTGGGGGGAGRSSGGPYDGGDGGSGIVVVRYQGASAATGGTQNTINVGGQDYTVHSFTSTGASSLDFSSLDLNTRLGATLSGNIGGSGGLTLDSPGRLILTGTNTYSGPTAVEQGTFLVNGDMSGATGALSVASGAVLGGNGVIGGNVSLAQGAFLAFHTTYTLTLEGTFSLDSSFGVESLRSIEGGSVDWSMVANGTYTLLTGDNLPIFNSTNISNFGPGDPFGLPDGRVAYFDDGSLLLVVIPEPGVMALLMGALALLLGRRRCART